MARLAAADLKLSMPEAEADAKANGKEVEVEQVVEEVNPPGEAAEAVEIE